MLDRRDVEPSGSFVLRRLFDTGGTSPTVSSSKVSGGGNTPVQGSVTSVTTPSVPSEPMNRSIKSMSEAAK
jgi:hypothetical protein